MKNVRFIGLDVHAQTIAAAVAEPNGEVRNLGTIANRIESVRKLLKKLGTPGQLRVCYEAGPTGYALYWQLTQLGVKCEVIAPTLMPMKAGDRVKTDRRDAERLARSYRAGDLTAVWVPDPAHEALRDLVRAREAAKKDQLRARHRLSKFLLRQGRRAPEGTKAWTGKYLKWVQEQRLDGRLMTARWERVRGARAVCDSRLASGEWSYPQAVEFFARETDFTKEQAEASVAMIAENPGYVIAYTVGRQQIELLLAEYLRGTQGKGSLRDFHDRLLSYGTTPLAIVGPELLADLEKPTSAVRAAANY